MLQDTEVTLPENSYSKSNGLKPVIEIKNLYTRHNDNLIHEDLNLTIYPNRIISLIGASGSGKTTLIRRILMLEPIDKGQIYLAGEEISKYNLGDTKIHLLLSRLGMMFQQGALFSSLSVIENVMFPLKEYTNFSDSTIFKLASLKLAMTGLASTNYKKYPKELSPGMVKRVALARALVLDPKVIFLDEPTAGLDPNSAHEFDELILQLHKSLGLTVIMITHDLDSILSISDEIIYLANKQVVFHGTLHQAIRKEDIPELYNYFNGTRGRFRINENMHSI